MISFHSKNYIVKYKKATPEQWYGAEPRSNEYHQVFGIYRQPNETNAIGSAMDMLCNLYASRCEADLNKRQIICYDEYDELDGVFYDFRATAEGEEDNFTDTGKDTVSFPAAYPSPKTISAMQAKTV